MKKIKYLFLALLLVAFLSPAAFGTDVRDNMNFKGRTTINGFALKVKTITMAAVDYTLSAAEYMCNILIVEGSPSGKAIIAPTFANDGVARLYTIRNAGADSASVLFKKSGGTAVTIATGKTAEVYWGGTNYLRKTADATN